MESERVLLVFYLAGQLAALPLENVQSIVPMAQLSRPPGLPSPLEGILNLAGRAVPVWRLDRLLQLPEQRAGLYSMLILLKGVSDVPTALLENSRKTGTVSSAPTEGRESSSTVWRRASAPFALLVDRVTEILSVPEIALLPIGKEDSFNGCAEATVLARGQVIHLLSPERVLMKKEREALSEFQAMAQRRIRDWEPTNQ
jgi:purine-binding chemotaxis protein CheW